MPKDKNKGMLTSLTVQPTTYHQVIEAQRAYPELPQVLQWLKVLWHDDETVRFKGRLYIPIEESLRKDVLAEAH